DLIDAALRPFETSLNGFPESAVADALRTVAESMSDESQRTRLKAERSAMMFRLVEDGPSVWGTAYAPLAVLKGDSGNEMYVPDISEADDSTIQYWTERSKTSHHPILRARYADLAWEFAPQVTKRKRDVTHARAAIDAYVEASTLQYPFAVQPIR